MFTIGKLAGLTSVSNDTLRCYEHEGLIRPTAKSAAGGMASHSVTLIRLSSNATERRVGCVPSGDSICNRRVPGMHLRL
jgi:hypothetical protein